MPSGIEAFRVTVEAAHDVVFRKIMNDLAALGDERR
jgi:hypothetical protein